MWATLDIRLTRYFLQAALSAPIHDQHPVAPSGLLGTFQGCNTAYRLHLLPYSQS